MASSVGGSLPEANIMEKLSYNSRTPNKHVEYVIFMDKRTQVFMSMLRWIES